MRATGTTS
jgi:hypothetical protein